MLDRPNLVDTPKERFRPPAQRGPAITILDKAILVARRTFDLQFGSIWQDMSRLLPEMRGTVVDVGCGAQPFRSLFAKDVSYIGVDIASSEAQFGYNTPDTRYYQGDVLPIDSETADGVLCTETLEHVLEPRIMLRELHRCLKPGGTLVMSVPFAARWHFIPFDYWRYTPSSLAHLLTENGFTKVAVFARGGAVTVACYKVMGCVLGLVAADSWISRAGALILSPVFAVAVGIANVALALNESGADCLGYTITAVREGRQTV